MKQLRYYKPSKTGKGCASAWQLSYKKDKKFDQYEFFLVTATQIADDKDGNNRFDWDNAIIVKMGEQDLGEILAVLEGAKESAGYNGSLFHKTPGGGNKSIKFNQSDHGFNLSVSYQNESKQVIGPYYHSISYGEAALLLTLLRRAVERIFDW